MESDPRQAPDRETAHASSIGGRRLRAMFDTVPRTYERVNHLLTFGLDIRWRRRAAAVALERNPRICLDACTGTGEMAALLRRRTQECTRVVGLDFSRAMLQEARQARGSADILWVCAALPILPLGTGTVDLITVAFATRNLRLDHDALVTAFAELHRILRPGGRLVVVETSQPPSRFIRSLFHLFVRGVVRPVGALVSGESLPYGYLTRSILRFHNAQELAAVLFEAGFEQVRFARLLWGVAAVHVADP